LVTAGDVREAAAALRGVVERTPLVLCDALGAYLKLENLQPVGAFKLRGAFNAIRQLPESVRRRGVITYSSGNHGQAVAFAARRFDVRAVVVMPETAPPVKVRGVERWGGEPVFAGRTSEDRLRKAQELAQREGLAVIPPFDHAHIVAGQATVGLEIAEQLPAARSVVVPVGGGGLIAGVVLGLDAGGSRARVWGVEPAGAPKLTRSLAAGSPVRLDRTASIADGLITLTVGALPLAVLQAHRSRVAGVALVEDDSISDAMHYLRVRCGVRAEPSGAAPAAAWRSGSLVPAPESPVVLVVSGGNVDPQAFEELSGNG
jgi:threonine dehydratase